MGKTAPDIQDAELILRVYDLRREPVMRESRNTMNGKFWPKSFAEVDAVMQPTHEFNAAFRQVSGYWEMVYSFARHGIVDPNFFVENNGEGLFFLAKIFPYLAQIREKSSPSAFRNSEWAASECEEGRRRFGVVRKRLESMLATK